MEVFGNLIAEIAKRGYTKNEMAKHLGMSRNTFTNKLLCKYEFTKTEFDSLCKEFFPDINPDYLFEKYQRNSNRHSA